LRVNRSHKNSSQKTHDKRLIFGSKFYQNEVRLIGEDDKLIGVMPFSEASEIARKKNLDLVEISSNIIPPVCKIMDYGKYKYSLQKEANLKRKSQKTTSMKTMQMRQGIGDADYQTKMKKVREFLTEGDKVKVTVRLQGREMTNKSLATNLLTKITNDLQDCAKIEKDVIQNNNNFFIILTPDVK
jgi:translation initiation factor IF-3